MLDPESRGHRECPICSNPVSSYFSSGRDRLFGITPGQFDLYRCSACRCIYQHPTPAEADLPDYYPDTYWWSPNGGERTLPGQLLKRLERSYRELVLLDHIRFLERCARNYKGNDQSLLDIGCGAGTFLHMAERRGFASHGMDASDRAVAVASRQYRFPVRRGSIGSDVWQGHRFRFITMFHVLEHLRDPLAALKYADGLLKPGGSLIIQVPNAESLQARIFGIRWYGFDIPRHLINFTAPALASLLARAGFEICGRSRFSLRDNPASLASSIAPGLDPVGRRGRGCEPGISEAVLEVIYLALFVASIPLALLEGMVGRGGTLWVEAKRSSDL